MGEVLSKMTPEMAFECLLVSDDPAVLGTMDPILHNFSIRTSICRNPLRASEGSQKRDTDLFVIDLEAAGSSEMLQQLRESQTNRKPTLLAVTATDGAVPGVHVIVHKPMTPQSGVRSLKVAYSKMLQDYRKYARCELTASVLATDENNQTFWLSLRNIGPGGVGLTMQEKIAIGSILSFQVKLPELEKEISVRTRILWTRPYGIAGSEFVHMPAFDLQLLHAWLESRYRIKKPLINV